MVQVVNTGAQRTQRKMQHQEHNEGIGYLPQLGFQYKMVRDNTDHFVQR